MANKIWFVPHPYDEPKGMGNHICQWNISDTHHRKLIHSSNAEVIGLNTDTKGFSRVSKKDIFFLGEWECCSKIRQNNGNNVFKYIHTPIYSEMDSYKRIINTDPFVFGDDFYYTCCKLRDRMEAGDIVLFGHFKYQSKSNTNKKPNNKVQSTDLFIDTVIVLKEKVNRFYSPSHKFPSGYEEVTLSKMPLDHDIWIAQMHHANNKFFSFVPCQIDNQSGYSPITEAPKVVVYSKANGIYLNGAQNGNHIEVSDIYDVYLDIVSQITTANWELGVKMPMPNTESLKNIIK